MRIARIFDLIDADHRSLQMESELKEADSVWGTPSEDVFAMMVWLKMLAESGHYTSLIESARRLFTQELESVEAIENAYLALPTTFILEPLHSQALEMCSAVRLKLMGTIKSLNIQYLENQRENFDITTRTAEAVVSHHANPPRQMHAAFVDFYRQIDELSGQVAAIKEVARSRSTKLVLILEQEKSLLEEKRAERDRIQKQIGNIRRALTRKTSEQSEDIRSSQWISLENEGSQREVRQLEEDFIALERKHKALEQDLKEKQEEIIRQDIEMRQNELITKSLGFGEGEITIKQLAAKYGVSESGVSQRVRKLIADGLLDQLGREGRRHKIFSHREVAIITHGWPSRRARKA